MRTLTLAILLTVVLPLHVRASEDPIFLDYRQVDPSGQYYVVVRRIGGPKHSWTSGRVEMLIARRRVGSPPVKPAHGSAKIVEAPRSPLTYATVVTATVGVRDGDLILGRTRLPDGPRKLLISSTGLGVMCLDEHGINPSVVNGPAIRVFSMSGKRKHVKKLRELFTNEEYRLFETGSYGIDWFRDAWIDEIRKQLIIVAAEQRTSMEVSVGLPDHSRVLVLDLRKGTVRKGSDEEIIQAIADARSAGRRSAIRLAAEMRIEAAAPVLTDILRHESDCGLHKLAESALARISLPQ